MIVKNERANLDRFGWLRFIAATQPTPRPKMELSPRSDEHLIQGGKKMEGEKWGHWAWIFLPHIFLPQCWSTVSTEG
jgi:hypothetical protein